jgi:hypothetical protein
MSTKENIQNDFFLKFLYFSFKNFKYYSLYFHYLQIKENLYLLSNSIYNILRI